MTEKATTRKRRPRGANGLGGASLRPDGLWQWRVTLDDGRRVYATAKTQDEARRKCLAKVALAEQGVDVKASRQTLGAYLAWWLDDVVAPERAPKTTTTYRDIVRLHVVPTLGKTTLERLSAKDVLALLRAKQREGKSPRTVAIIRAVLHTALAHAERLGMVPRNVAALVDPPRQVAVERRPFTPEEGRALLAAAEGDRLAALWRVTLTLGLRAGEVLGLRWDDVDLDAGEVRVRRNLQRVRREQVGPGHVVVSPGTKGGSVLILKEPKTARSRRTLALGPALVEALRAHRRRQAAERLAAKRWHDHGLVFATPVGTGTDPDNLAKAWKALLATAGLRDQRFHDLRHAAATLMLLDGMGVVEVSAVLGHAQTSTTLNTYAHALPGANRDAADRMERLLGSGRETRMVQ